MEDIDLKISILFSIERREVQLVRDGFSALPFLFLLYCTVFFVLSMAEPLSLSWQHIPLVGGEPYSS